MTLEDLSSQLAARQISQPRLEALNLLEMVTRLPRVKILAGDFQLSRWQNIRLRHLAWRRQRLPLAYLNGEKEFYGRTFHVSRQTLVPRPESEDLINLALGERRSFKHVYDVGAGSGCLGISYALEQAEGNPLIYFLDNNRRALRVVQKNCQRQALRKTQFIFVDLHHLEKPFFKPDSLILANLPYLDKKMRQAFEKDCPMLRSEPATALYAGENGLELYRLLFQLGKSQSLVIVCESLVNQQVALNDLAANYGFRLKAQLNLASLFVSNRKRVDA